MPSLPSTAPRVSSAPPRDAPSPCAHPPPHYSPPQIPSRRNGIRLCSWNGTSRAKSIALFFRSYRCVRLGGFITSQELVASRSSGVICTRLTPTNGSRSWRSRHVMPSTTLSCHSGWNPLYIEVRCASPNPKPDSAGISDL